MKQTNAALTGTLSLLAGLLFTVPALADTYEVTITNATHGETFTPRLVTTHSIGNLFTVGQPALEEVAIIAESGDVAPAMTLLESAPEIVDDIAVGDGLLGPGESQTVTVSGELGERLTVIAILIPTNDAFVSVNGVSLPASGSMSYCANVYDAGSETNDELCSNIPGPVCGGSGLSPEDEGEGHQKHPRTIGVLMT